MNEQTFKFNLLRLKMERVVRNVSVPTLAEALGISKGAYYKKESGQTAITVDDLCVIMNTLGVNQKDIGYFFTKPDDERVEIDVLLNR